jgi:hypothetical protein
MRSLLSNPPCKLIGVLYAGTADGVPSKWVINLHKGSWKRALLLEAAATACSADGAAGGKAISAESTARDVGSGASSAGRALLSRGDSRNDNFVKKVHTTSGSLASTHNGVRHRRRLQHVVALVLIKRPHPNQHLGHLRQPQ